jgi:hypothetical protein
MGPVEGLETQDGVTTLTVLGQRFIDRSEVAGQVAQGDYVMAAGNGDGQLQVLYSMEGRYVPGASPVMVVGTVGAVDGTHALTTVGITRFDYSSRLVRSPDYRPHTGELVQFSGTQPVPGGSVLVQESSPAGGNFSLRR